MITVLESCNACFDPHKLVVGEWASRIKGSRKMTNVLLVACAALVLALENLEARSGAAPGTTVGPSRKSPAPEAGHPYHGLCVL